MSFAYLIVGAEVKSLSLSQAVTVGVVGIVMSCSWSNLITAE